MCSSRAPSLVLERVPKPQHPVVPLKPRQVMQLPLVPGGPPISFGRGRDCTVRTDGPGVQATLSMNARGLMTLTFRGTMPAPGARTTAKAPHGLRVITRMPDEFFPDGRLKTRHSKLTQVTGTHRLQVGETISFTLHAGHQTCFTVRELGLNETVMGETAAASQAKSAGGKRKAKRAQPLMPVPPAKKAKSGVMCPSLHVRRSARLSVVSRQVSPPPIESTDIAAVAPETEPV